MSNRSNLAVVTLQLGMRWDPPTPSGVDSTKHRQKESHPFLPLYRYARSATHCVR